MTKFKLYKASTFLCIGPEIEACVVSLSPVERASLDDGLAVAMKYESQSGRLDVLKRTFKVACHYAIPCWSDQAMQAIATQYTGHDQKRVRGLAACLLTNTPFGGPEPGSRPNGDGGGGTAKLDPPKPVTPKPGGAAAKLVYEKGNGKARSKSKKKPARVPVSIR